MRRRMRDALAESRQNSNVRRKKSASRRRAPQVVAPGITAPAVFFALLSMQGRVKRYWRTSSVNASYLASALPRTVLRCARLRYSRIWCIHSARVSAPCPAALSMRFFQVSPSNLKCNMPDVASASRCCGEVRRCGAKAEDWLEGHLDLLRMLPDPHAKRRIERCDREAVRPHDNRPRPQRGAKVSSRPSGLGARATGAPPHPGS